MTSRWFPPDHWGLDIALGIGGLPRGRVVEIYGPESSGKTTLTLQVIAEMQKLGGTAAFIDAEHALDPAYAQKLGVNLDELLISQPDTGEQALEIADMLVRSASVDVVVIDSVAALVPKAEIEGEMGDSLPGLQARLMSQALRKLTANINRTNTLVIFINQIRMKIGVMFGSPETTTGGNALKFYASVRLDIRRIGSIKKGDEVIGNETRVKVVKNKVAPLFAKPSSTSSTAREPPGKGRSSNSACCTNWSTSRAPGMPTTVKKLDRARTMPVIT
jgi:recombination protein RecA